MTFRGKVKNGVVVLQDGVRLPEGAEVLVEAKEAAPGVSRSEETAAIWGKLSELGRSVEQQPTSLPEDLEENHDHYLHGLPKRRQ